LSPDIMGSALAAKPGEIFVARGRNAIVVGRVDGLHAGDADALARLSEQTRPQMTQTIFRETVETAEAAARRTVKVAIDYNRARGAIGLPPLNAQGKPEPAK
jgi:hypothetical protein